MKNPMILINISTLLYINLVKFEMFCQKIGMTYNLEGLFGWIKIKI